MKEFTLSVSKQDWKTEACIALVTCGNKDEAERIASHIVNERLAACVNVIGSNDTLTSFYRWEDKLQKEPEILLMIKTTQRGLPQLEARIQALHSYSVPEFIVLPVVFGGQSYLRWIADNVG